MRIAVFGLGYSVAVTAAGLAARRHDVRHVDVAVKVNHTRSGQTPVVDPGINELIATAVEHGNLRSTNIELAERLTGKGFDVRIYDTIFNPDRLIGSILRYIESRLPHLRRLFFRTPSEAMQGSDAAVMATSDRPVIDELRASPPDWILDRHVHLGAAIEDLPGYEGIGWAG